MARRISPEQEATRRDDAIAKLGGKIAKRGDVRAADHVGARIGDWGILATDGHVALLARGPAKDGARDLSSMLVLDGATCVSVTPDMRPAARRVGLFGNRDKRNSVSAVSLILGWDRLWMYASHDQDCAREWMPCAWARLGDAYHDTPIATDARLLDEGFEVAGIDGRLHLSAERDRAMLFESSDGKYALVLMPLRSGANDCVELGELAARFEGHARLSEAA